MLWILSWMARYTIPKPHLALTCCMCALLFSGVPRLLYHAVDSFFSKLSRRCKEMKEDIDVSVIKEACVISEDV